MVSRPPSTGSFSRGPVNTRPKKRIRGEPLSGMAKVQLTPQLDRWGAKPFSRSREVHVKAEVSRELRPLVTPRQLELAAEYPA